CYAFSIPPLLVTAWIDRRLSRWRPLVSGLAGFGIATGLCILMHEVGSAEMQRSFSTTCSLLDLCGVCQLRCVRGWRVKRWFRKDRTTEYFCEFGPPATLQTSP